jgi:hypothetical protein
MLKKKQAANLEKAGLKTSLRGAYMKKAVNNYSMLANEVTIAISQLYIPKLNTWYVAENSIRGSIATLGAIASTHFITVDKEDDNIHAEIESLLDAAHYPRPIAPTLCLGPLADISKETKNICVSDNEKL